MGGYGRIGVYRVLKGEGGGVVEGGGRGAEKVWSILKGGGGQNVSNP